MKSLAVVAHGGQEAWSPHHINGRNDGVTSRKTVLVIPGIHQGGETNLPEVIEATGLLRLLLCLGEGRQKHPGQDRDNRDHHQEFDQCKSRTFSTFHDGLHIGKIKNAPRKANEISSISRPGLDREWTFAGSGGGAKSRPPGRLQARFQ